MTPAIDVSDSVVQLDGQRALLRRRRPTQPSRGPALMLVHGAGGNHLAFEELIAALPPELDVLVPALPGRLDSDGPPPADVSAAASFVRELGDALGLEQVVVGGHSFGGAVALELAIATAQGGGGANLRGLVLMATGARLRVHPMILKAMARAADSGQFSDAALSVFRSDTDPALVRAVGERLARTPPSTALADWHAANAFDRMADVSRIAVPTLLLGGAEDALTPLKYAQYLAAQIQSSTLALLENAGHLFPNERAAETARHIGAFMRSLMGS